jgi:YihY family inner membrane protein
MMDYSKFKEKAQKSNEKARDLYRKVNKRTGGILGILRHAFTNFTNAHGVEAAASISFYALFSIFPLLLVFISIAGYFLEREVAQAKVLEAVTAAIPLAENVIVDNIATVMRLRGTVGALALITLIWSASNVFNKVILNVNRAFPEVRTPNFFRSRLLALIIIFTLGLLFILSIAATTVIELIPTFTIPINGKNLYETTLWYFISILVPVIIEFFLFWGLFQWIPHTAIKRKASVIGALFAAISWELVTNGFTWFLSNGFVNYQLIYGSLGAIVALLFWIYLTGQITIFGAHLTYAINYHLRAKENATLETQEQV